MFRLGLIINPIAGVGGPLGFKGSDEVAQLALAQGGICKANDRTRQALSTLAAIKDKVHIFTAAGLMGEQVCLSLGLSHELVYCPATPQTQAQDTRETAGKLMEAKVDLIVFAGGDGTARDICEVVGNRGYVLGIPAGCKMHSGVYGVTVNACSQILLKMITGQLLSVMAGEVRDIDEQARREGKIRSRYYGELWVPEDLRYVQRVKQSGREDSERVRADIAAWIVEQMEPDICYIMGSGQTVAAVMAELSLANSLLGVDLVENGQLIGQDLNAQQLLTKIQGRRCRLLLSFIGGQGHLLGRGNQQLSPEVIHAVGIENIDVLASKTKISGLEGRPIWVDTDDVSLNQALSGYIRIITGYHDQVIYPVASTQ